MIAIFAEKFDVAIKICVSLSNFSHEGKVITMQNLEKNKKTLEKAYKPKGYININYSGGAIITWGQGHLVRLKNASDYNSIYKSWRNLPIPFIPSRYELTAIDSPFAKKQLSVVKQVFDKCDSIINATDYDREGDLIFSYVYEYLGCKKPYKRVKLDSQTEDGFKKAFSNFIDIDMVKNVEKAGRARSLADWVVGINLTVAKSLCDKKMMSIGRVQTPTLNIIVQREDEILNFKPKDYYVIESEFTNGNRKYIGKIKEQFENLSLTEDTLKKCIGKATVTNIESKDVNEYPPHLYNLNSLSVDANNKYGITSKDTLDIAQSLYEKGYTTYPRTSSAYLTDDMVGTVAEVLDRLSESVLPVINKCKKRNFTKRYYDTSKVESHYAIIPTNNIPDLNNLTENEKKVYMLIARSIAMSIFDPAIISKTIVTTSINEIDFISNGNIIKEKNYLEVLDDYNPKEVILPKLEEGEIFNSNPSFSKNKTKPPKRFTDATLLGFMKNAGTKADNENELTTESGIGTSATRANIIENLLSKEYIKRDKKVFIPTEKGIHLIKTLSVEEIKSPYMTAEWEDLLNKIEKGTYSFNNFKKGIEDKTREWTSNSYFNIKLDTSEYKETKYTCPLCRSKIKENEKIYKCNCGFGIQKTTCGINLPEEQINKLFIDGNTDTIKGFKRNDGTEFDAIIYIDKTAYNPKTGKTDKALKFKSPNARSYKESNVKCKKCGSTILEYDTFFRCPKCSIILGKNIANKSFSAEDLAEICKSKKIGPFSDFIGKKGQFQASLVYDSKEKKIKFKF